MITAAGISFFNYMRMVSKNMPLWKLHNSKWVRLYTYSKYAENLLEINCKNAH
jgi:hypothetical protein